MEVLNNNRTSKTTILIMDQAKCSEKESNLLKKILFKTWSKNSLLRNLLIWGGNYGTLKILVKTQIVKALFDRELKFINKIESQVSTLIPQEVAINGKTLLKIFPDWNLMKGFHLKEFQQKTSTCKANHTILSQRHTSTAQIQWGGLKEQNNIWMTNLKPIVIKWINYVKKLSHLRIKTQLKTAAKIK